MKAGFYLSPDGTAIVEIYRHWSSGDYQMFFNKDLSYVWFTNRELKIFFSAWELLE